MAFATWIKVVVSTKIVIIKVVHKMIPHVNFYVYFMTA